MQRTIWEDWRRHAFADAFVHIANSHLSPRKNPKKTRGINRIGRLDRVSISLTRGWQMVGSGESGDKEKGKKKKSYGAA